MSQTAENATHWLHCTHVTNGRSRVDYRMPCHVLGVTPRGFLKVRVFGERFWKDRLHKSRVRYVSAGRVSKKV